MASEAPENSENAPASPETAGGADKAAPASAEEAAKPAAPRPPPKAAAPVQPDAAPLRPVEIAGIVGVLALLGAGAWILFRSPEAPEPRPKAPAASRPASDSDEGWAVGKKVDVELTLLPADRANVACASPLEVAGKHCEYETPEKPWSKPPADAKAILKPYATTGELRILGAGLWDDAGLKGPLPSGRFQVRCKYSIEGKMPTPIIRWNPKDVWRPLKNPWWTGTLAHCRVLR